MALLFLEKKESKVLKTGGFSYQNWYKQNKQRLAEKRAKRYREDSKYRAAALQRSRSQRVNKVVEPDPEGFNIPLKEVARKLGVTIWVLRDWRRKNYFPEPRLRGGMLWFQDTHVSLLGRLKSFFDDKGSRVSQKNQDELTQLVALIYSNW